ncbi:30S ribosomal protein S9 [Candidatus Woesebacteria bacterium GWB1_43_5]|uniref:30S ribosomal protein S9 n=1 Tax=Candidatus Woesebacteria bacterium GWB1_43_5 TaxID=1802474 RepID=A0A1F7WTW1_9BACT|nr:MAG: 30S ribosomal protein S9 [Candidatus Woesebacteria bacterium GWB1_43_5]
MAKTKKIDYIYEKGRRREASARIRLLKGKGESLVNDVSLAQYFPGDVNRTLLERPFALTKTLDKHHFTVKVAGGGKNGQLEAVILGIARALVAVNPDFRPILKKAGLLTRDPRTRERRKVGMGGKARRKKQSPKR